MSNDAPRPRTVVRLTTNWYAPSRGGLAQCRKITPLKRLCIGHDCLNDYISSVGAEEVGAMILNWATAKDGIYELVVVNEKRDWETGYVEDWQYELRPFTL